MKRDDGLILFGLFAAVLFFVILRMPFPTRNSISEHTLHSLPESVVMVYLGSASLPIQGIYENMDLEEPVTPEGVSVVAQVLVERDGGYIWVAFSQSEHALKKGGAEWGDVVLFGPEEGIEVFLSSSVSDEKVVSSLPEDFQQKGTILMRPSFLARIMPGVEHIQDRGWVGLRYFPISDSRGLLFDVFSRSKNGAHFTPKKQVREKDRAFVEIFFPINDAPIGPGRRLSGRFDKDFQEVFMIDGIRTDILIPTDLSEGTARLQGLEEGKAQIQEIRSYLASHTASFVLMDQDDSLRAALYVELEEGDAQILEPLILDVIRKKVSLLHASQKTVSTENGRRISHLLPHADPDMFIERKPFPEGIMLYIPCGTVPLFLGTEDCTEHNLVLALSETMLLISNDAEFVQNIIEYPYEKRKSSEAFIYIDKASIRQHEGFDIISNMISESFGLELIFPEINGIEGRIKNIEGGILFRGTIW